MSVMEVTSIYYNKPIDPNGGARFKKTTIKSSLASSTFHEIGHVVHEGKTQDKVINFENYVKKHLGLPDRKKDETHNKTIKKGQYGN